jgi:hypothetical protein
MLKRAMFENTAVADTNVLTGETGSTVPTWKCAIKVKSVFVSDIIIITSIIINCDI